MSFLKPVLRISSNTGKHAGRTSPPLQTPQDKEAIVVTSLEILQPDEQTLEDDNAGGLGRHLGLFSTTFLIIGRIIGVGIFSTPSSITNSVGSVGAALMLWLLGLALSFAGLGVWLELGCMFPRSGGEKVYLEVSYPRPYLLSTVIFSTHAVLLGFTASGCILFAANILVAADQPVSEWAKRGIAISVLSGVTLMHVFWPHWGIRIMNVLGTIKVFVLAFVVVTGWAVLGGAVHSIPDPQASFRNAFAGSSTSSNDYATAFFKVLNSYAGWSNAAYVLNEVRRPVHTLKIAGPLGLGVCGLLYILANVSYFSVATPKEIAASGNTVAAYFFGRVFGPAAKRALSVFVSLSALSNVMAVAFTHARIIQELAKEGVLPFAQFWGSTWPVGAPSAGFLLNFIITLIVLLAIPFGDAYNFIMGLEGFSSSVILFVVTIGLFILRHKFPSMPRPFKVWWPVAVFYMLTKAFLLVAPFLRPPGGKGDTSLPYWLYPIVGIAVLISGVAYWFMWRKVLPAVGRFKWEERKVALEDGTVVMRFEKVKCS